MKTTFSLLTVFSLGLVAFVAADQNENVETTAERSAAELQETVDTPTDAIRVSLSKDGVLTGKVFENVDDRQEPVAAKVTISRLNGDAITSETTGEDGTFTFESIEPGYYAIVGVGPGYFGDQIIDVAPHGDTYAATVPVQMTRAIEPGTVFMDNSNAPLQTFSSDVVEWQGTGGYSSGGGGHHRKFCKFLGLAGLVGLVGLTDDEDASPDM